MNTKVQPRPYPQLPRPTRVASEATTPFLNAQLLPLIQPIRDLPVHHIVKAMLLNPETGPRLEAAMHREGAPHGVLFMVSEVLFEGGPHQIYELAPELVDLLMQTDFSSEHPVPASFCRLPSADPIFVHVPRPPAQLDVPSQHDVLPLCGYYLREVVTPTGRLIEVIAVSQPPPGLKSTSADNFLFSDIPISDEERSLHETFVDADQASRISMGKPDAPQLRAHMKPHLEFLVKTLCYLGMRDVRREVHTDHTEAVAAVQGLGPKKRDAAVARARKLYDYVRIAPPAADAEFEPQDGSGRAVTAHHRRGHFRLAHVGQGRQERRVVWVRPTIVGLPSSATRVTTYRVS